AVSRANRSRATTSAANSGARILIATCRERRRSRARNTTPMPPCPSSRTDSNRAGSNDSFRPVSGSTGRAKRFELPRRAEGYGNRVRPSRKSSWGANALGRQDSELLQEGQLIHAEPVFDDLPVADSHDVCELQGHALPARRDAVQLGGVSAGERLLGDDLI